jgi:regulator of CtrA degradation
MGTLLTLHNQFEKFIERTYDETIQLLEEAIDYCTHEGKENVQDLEPVDKLRIAGEKMRVTARLSGIMAWLLVQKALVNGEFSLDQARSEPSQLDPFDVCNFEGQMGKKDCSEPLVRMLDRSRDLYGRVVKMDMMAMRLYAKSA